MSKSRIHGHRVGIASRPDGPFAPVPPNVLRAIRSAGGLPKPLAIVAPQPLTEIDSLLLTGGADVTSVHPGATRPNQPVTSRDLVEQALLLDALEIGLPVLAICRGMQLINIAFGGTSGPIAACRAQSPDNPGVEHGTSEAWALHEVTVRAGSHLSAAVDSNYIPRCSSHHSRGIRTIAPNIEPVAWAPDGIIEAIELRDYPWLLGVLWHPEDTAASDAVQQAIFDTLVGL